MINQVQLFFQAPATMLPNTQLVNHHQQLQVLLLLLLIRRHLNHLLGVLSSWTSKVVDLMKEVLIETFRITCSRLLLLYLLLPSHQVPTKWILRTNPKRTPLPQSFPTKETLPQAPSPKKQKKNCLLNQLSLQFNLNRISNLSSCLSTLNKYTNNRQSNHCHK